MLVLHAFINSAIKKHFATEQPGSFNTRERYFPSPKYGGNFEHNLTHPYFLSIKTQMAPMGAPGRLVSFNSTLT